jgi:GNAT superfamily N-acetyltransferase
MLVFTAFHWRRHGIAKALLDAAAEHTGAGLGGMSWTTPFTEAGTALARSCAGPDGAVWIA